MDAEKRQCIKGGVSAKWEGLIIYLFPRLGRRAIDPAEWTHRAYRLIQKYLIEGEEVGLMEWLESLPDYFLVNIAKSRVRIPSLMISDYEETTQYKIPRSVLYGIELFLPASISRLYDPNGIKFERISLCSREDLIISYLEFLTNTKKIPVLIKALISQIDSLESSDIPRIDRFLSSLEPLACSWQGELMTIVTDVANQLSTPLRHRRPLRKASMPLEPLQPATRTDPLRTQLGRGGTRSVDLR